MKVIVLKGFPYADARGIKTSYLGAGEQELPAEIVDALPGLIADGYIDGDGHPPVGLTAGRRASIIAEIAAAGRARLEGMSDAHLADLYASFRAHEASAAADLETKVIDAAPETGAPMDIISETPPAVAGAETASTAEEREGSNESAELNLTEAQIKALDRDGDGEAGGAPKGGNRKKPAAE